MELAGDLADQRDAQAPALERGRVLFTPLRGAFGIGRIETDLAEDVLGIDAVVFEQTPEDTCR